MGVFSFWEALGKALLGALVVVFLGVCVGLPNFADSRESYTWLLRTIYIIISVASGVRISLAFLKLCPLLLPSELLNHILSQKWLTLLLALMLCFPAAWIQDPSRIDWQDPISLIYLFRNLFIVVVILSLVSFLKELDGGNIWPSLSITDIDCGVALAITAFFSWSSVWFYFPIPLIAGFILMRWFLFVEPVQTALASKLNLEWKSLINSVLELQRAQKLLENVQKGLQEKLAKGDIAFADYQGRLAPIIEETHKQRAALTVEGWAVDRLLFSYGTAGSSWRSGCNAGWYSLVFALPWIVLSIRDLLSRHTETTDVLLYFLGSTLIVIARWIGYGFFFGTSTHIFEVTTVCRKRSRSGSP